MSESNEKFVIRCIGPLRCCSSWCGNPDCMQLHRGDSWTDIAKKIGYAFKHNPRPVPFGGTPPSTPTNKRPISTPSSTPERKLHHAVCRRLSTITKATQTTIRDRRGDVIKETITQRTCLDTFTMDLF
jgi:hypothetical protein